MKLPDAPSIGGIIEEDVAGPTIGGCVRASCGPASQQGDTKHPPLETNSNPWRLPAFEAIRDSKTPTGASNGGGYSGGGYSNGYTRPPRAAPRPSTGGKPPSRGATSTSKSPRNTSRPGRERAVSQPAEVFDHLTCTTPGCQSPSVFVQDNGLCVSCNKKSVLQKRLSNICESLPLDRAVTHRLSLVAFNQSPVCSVWRQTHIHSHTCWLRIIRW